MEEVASYGSGSVAGEFLGLVRDVSQFLARQKDLSNTHIQVSPESLDMIEKWGNPSPRAPLPGSVSENPARFTPVSRTVRSQGPETARVWFVDSVGAFYSGQAGSLLTKILAAMTLSPESVCICAPDNPAGLREKLKGSPPKAVVCMGEKAARLFIQTPAPLAAFRGQWHEIDGIPLMPTFHPKQLLGDLSLKRPVWEDMQQVMKKAGLVS